MLHASDTMIAPQLRSQPNMIAYVMSCFLWVDLMSVTILFGWARFTRGWEVKIDCKERALEE